MVKSLEININMNNHTKFNPGIIAFDIKPNGMLIGTKGGEIYEFKQTKPTLLLQGHSDGEVWGLAVHPQKYQYVTCGGDYILRKWDAINHQMIAHSEKLNYDVRAVDWAPKDGQFIIAGDMKGKVLLFDVNLKLMKQLQS